MIYTLLAIGRTDEFVLIRSFRTLYPVYCTVFSPQVSNRGYAATCETGDYKQHGKGPPPNENVSVAEIIRTRNIGPQQESRKPEKLRQINIMFTEQKCSSFYIIFCYNPFMPATAVAVYLRTFNVYAIIRIYKLCGRPATKYESPQRT